MAAGKTPGSSLARLLVLAVLLTMSGGSLGGRQIQQSAADPMNADRKQPEWFIEPDNTGSIFIPGIGHIVVPPQFSFPYVGSIGGGTRRKYIPGGDDTLIPNPGIEVPIPSRP